ncbi:MAG: hypothetical protein AAF205_04240 [Pseudomonadota bacterium]
MKIVRAGALTPFLALLLAGCGSVGTLAWPQGEPPAPAVGYETARTVEERFVPPPQAAPVRVDDPVRNADERVEDPFDLPPQ